MKLLYGCLIASCILLPQSIFAENDYLTLTVPNIPPTFSAEYTVKASGLTVAKFNVKLTQEDEHHWTYHSVSDAVGLAAMFMGGEPVTDTSKLTLADGIIRPSFYERIRKTKKEDKSERVAYHWEKLLAHSEYTDRKLDITLNNQVTDKFTLQLLIMANINHIPNEMTLPIISKAKLKDYLIVNNGREKINTAYGERETIVIERKKDDSSYKIWADPAIHGLPLQIERIKEGKTEYIVRLVDTSLLDDSNKISENTTNQQSSYFQSK